MPRTEPAEPAVRTDVARGADLPATALYCATWRDAPPLPRPDPAPFDKDDCLRRLARVRANDYAGSGADWDPVEIAPALSREEADFWLTAIVKYCERQKPGPRLVEGLSGLEFAGETGLPLAKAQFQKHGRMPPPQLAGVLANLMGPVRFLDALSAGEFRQLTPTMGWARGQNDLAMARGSWEHVRPYLTADELARLREVVRPRLDPAAWPKKYDDPHAIAYYVAALAGMHDEVWQLVRGWQFGPSDPTRHFLNNCQPLLVLLGLRDPAVLMAKARDLNLPVASVFTLRAWLAHTGVAGIDYAAEQVVHHQRYADRRLVAEFARVRDPAAAKHVLALRLTSRQPAVARGWLEENVGSAVAGLLPLVGGRDRIALAAVDYLRDVVKRGYGWVIEREAAALDPQQAGKVRRAVLDRPERVVPEIEAGTEPEWLTAALKAAPPQRGSLPGWVNPVTLPPIVVDGKRLAEPHVRALLYELKAVPAGTVAALAAAVKQHAEPGSRDAFAVELFDRWLAELTPYPDNWVLPALGRLGGDAAVAALVPRLRRWPGGSSARRVRDGIAAVRAVGTDYALAQLAHLAVTHPNTRARRVAADELAAAAADRGLTPDQLEDRTVPDLDLAAGGPVLDYGPRRFRLALGPDLRPAARDEKGKLHAALPTPRKSDDPLLVSEAREAFKQLKAQAAEVVGAVCRRLERGLVHQRRWPAEDFERFLVRHPVAGAVARRLVWGWFAEDGSLAGTFRVTEEGELAGPHDRPARAAGPVGLVHPVQMAPADRDAWAERFADYELVPPFPQLARPVVELDPGQAAATEVTWFNAKGVPYRGSLAKSIKDGGWVRRAAMVRTFPAAGVTAAVKVSGWDRIDVHGCVFLPRADPNAEYQPEQAVPLGGVDPVARCEVLADLRAWSRAAGT